MIRYIKCAQKLVGSKLQLLSKEDADMIASDIRAYEQEGRAPDVAEKMAIQDAIDHTHAVGESILDQIRQSAPHVVDHATEFWNRETIRKAGTGPARVAPVTPAVARPEVAAQPAEVTAGPPAPVAPAPAPASVTPATPAPVAPAPAPVAPAPAPRGELTPEHRTIVESLPPEMRAKAADALAEDLSPEPHSQKLKATPAIAAESNTKVLGDLQKYGALTEGVTAQEVLDRAAADKSNPRWVRSTLALLSQIGVGKGVTIETVNRPDSNWNALYVHPGKVLINLARESKMGVARLLAHELVHHVTMVKLRANPATLSPEERAAREELENIFAQIQNRPQFKGEYGNLSVEEFASEIFASDSLRRKLNQIKIGDSPLSVMQRIRNAITRLVYGDAGVQKGTVLEEAMRNVLNVAGVPAAGLESATRGRAATAARRQLMELAKPPTAPAQEGGPPGISPVTSFDNYILTAPMVEAFHGTPHEIEGQMSTDRILSGEGAIAYGWGLYFAQRKGIAESYAENLSREADPRDRLSAFVQRANVPGKPAPTRAEIIDKLKTYKEVKAYADQPEILNLIVEVVQGYQPKTDTWTPSAMRAMQQMDRVLPPPPKGNVYKLRLDVEDNELLDWDKPLSEQPDAVKKAFSSSEVTNKGIAIWRAKLERGEATQEEVDNAITNLRASEELGIGGSKAEQKFLQSLPQEARALAGKMIHGPESGRTDSQQAKDNWARLEELAPDANLNAIHDIVQESYNKSGEDLYRDLTKDEGGMEQASKFLMSNGLKGIRYLDNVSRGKGWIAKGPGADPIILKFPDEATTRKWALQGGEGWTVEKEATTNNFVIFDGKHIEITHKNGEPVATVASADKQSKAGPNAKVVDEKGAPISAPMVEQVEPEKLRETIVALPRLAEGDKSASGLVTRKGIPNTSSISSSLNEWTEHGVRDVPMSWFTGKPGEKALADSIRESGEINPLIIVADGHPDGPAYILEGSHRFDALRTLGVKSFPALVVLDEEGLAENMASVTAAAAEGEAEEIPAKAKGKKRAAVGGEVGVNKEWYKGGQFISTTDMPKKVRENIRKAATGREQFEVGMGADVWSVPEPGMMPIIGRTFGMLDWRKGEMLPQAMEYANLEPEVVAQLNRAAAAWKSGEKFISVADYPLLAGYRDVARLINAGRPIPAGLIDRMPEPRRSELKQAAEKFKPEGPITAAAAEGQEPTKPPEQLTSGEIRSEITRQRKAMGLKVKEQWSPGDQGDLFPYAMTAFKLRDGTVAKAAAHALIELPEGYTEDDIVADGFTFGGRFVQPKSLTLEGFHKAAIMEATKEGAPVSPKVAKEYGLGTEPPGPITAAAAEGQEIEPQEGFYSGVAKIVNRKMPNAAPAQQVKAILKDAPAEDIKWSGVTQVIDRLAAENNGKVPKEALLKYLQDEGKVQLQEVTLTEKGLGRVEAREMSDLLGTFDRTSDQQARLAELSRKQNEAQRPKFGQYVLPGGENYREVVLSMPEKTDQFYSSFDEFFRAQFGDYADPSNPFHARAMKNAREKWDRYNGKIAVEDFAGARVGRSTDNYTSSHFPDVPNYVAHARMNERVDAEGKPGLFLEEIQSDRHQQAREKGYEDGYAVTNMRTKEIMQIFPTMEEADKFASKTHKETNIPLKVDFQKGVPDAPFRKDWHVQMFKRALRDAIAHGKEWIGWTSGETQAERYNLSKQVDKIAYYPKGMTLGAYKEGEKIIDKSMVAPEHLPDLIGKEAAERIMNNPTSVGATGVRILSGLDLKVGGEGMKDFYDKILPNAIGEYVRKGWKAKVEQGELDIRKPEDEAWYEEPKPEHFAPIWKVEITPQMKETIGAKGQSLFGATAAAQEMPVQDETDVVSAPLSQQGQLTRLPILPPWARKDTGPYKPGGQLTAAGRFSKEIFNLLKTKTQSGAAVIARSDFVARDLQRLLKKNYGPKLTEAQNRTMNTALGTMDNRLTPEQDAEAKRIQDPQDKASFIQTAKLENLEAFKVEQAASLASLPPELQNRVVEMRELIDEMSKDLIRDGHLSVEMKASITDNLGTYLHRSYKNFDGDVWGKWIISDDPKAVGIRERAIALFTQYVRAKAASDYAIAMRAAGTPVTRVQARAHAQSLNLDNEAANMLNDYLAKGDSTSRINLLGGSLPGKKGMAIMTLRGQIPQEVRDLWGQYDDPVVNFAKTYSSMGTWLANQKFQQGVLEDGLAKGYIWKEGVSTDSRPVGYVKFAGDAASMGPLAEAYGPAELRDAFALYNTPAVQDGLAKMVAIPLAAKTVYSTTGIIRNFLGNPAFRIMQDAFLPVIPGRLNKSRAATWANIRKLGTTEGREYAVRLHELGILGDNVGPSVIKKIGLDSQKAERLDLDGEPGWMMKAWEGAKDVAGTTGEAFQSAYGGVDDFWKVYGFESELRKYEWAYKNDPNAPGKAELEKEAADIVRKTTPTYSEAPAWVRDKLGKSKFGKYIAPFIMFTTEVYRTTAGTMEQAAKEISNPNPKIKLIGARRVAGMMIVASMPALLAYATKAMFGYDDDDEDTVRAGLPDYQKNATLLFLPKDKNGNPRFLDISYANPFKVITDPVSTFLRALKNRKSAGEAAIEGLKEVARPFISEQLLVSAGVDVYRNQDSARNYKPLYNEEDTEGVKWMARAERIWRAFSPGTLDQAWRVGLAAQGVVKPSGRAYDLPTEATAAVTGQRIQSFDRTQGLQGFTARFEASKKNAENLFNAPFNNRGTVPVSDVTTGYNKANTARKVLYRDMRENYIGSMHLGLTKAQAKTAMEIGFGTQIKKSGLSQKDLDDIMHGRYHRYEPSKPSLDEARRSHPDRYQAYLKARNAVPATESLVN